jgi:hypothetical protein
MPLTSPTYGAAYDQTEQNTNAATMTGFSDTLTTADASIKSALVTFLTLAQPILANAASSNGTTSPTSSEISTACQVLITALS